MNRDDHQIAIKPSEEIDGGEIGNRGISKRVSLFVQRFNVSREDGEVRGRMRMNESACLSAPFFALVYSLAVAEGQILVFDHVLNLTF